MKQNQAFLKAGIIIAMMLVAALSLITISAAWDYQEPLNDDSYFWIAFDGKYTTTIYGGEEFKMIGPHTDMMLIANTSQYHFESLTYSVWWNQTAPGVYLKIRDPVTIYDNGPLDEDRSGGNIAVRTNFTRGCFHEIIVDLDYRGSQGNIIRHDYDFSVDATSPEIIKTVGEPEVDACGGFMSWVNMSTPFSFTASDFGCNGGSGVWRIGYEVRQKHLGDNNWTIVQNVEIYDEDVGDEWGAIGHILNTTHMTEECIHEVSFWAEDFVGNNVSYKQKHLVDNSGPGISIKVGDPACYCGCDKCPDEVRCVTTNTPINISVYDIGCESGLDCWPSECGVGTDGFYYRIWNMIDGWTEWKYFKLLNKTIYFEEECMHYLEIKSIDYLGNMNLVNKTFYVDETPPEIIKTVHEPKVEGFLNGHFAWALSVESSFVGSSSSSIYRYVGPWGWSNIGLQEDFYDNTLWEANETSFSHVGSGLPYSFNTTRWFEDEYAKWLIEYDNSTIPNHHDTKFQLVISSDGMSPLYHIGINNTGGKFICWYDIMTGSWGPQMPLPAEIIIVGEQNDESFEVWIPMSFVEKVKADWWVTSDTMISIDAIEMGCCPCPVEGIEFRIWEDGEWSKWIEYEGSFTFDKDCAHYLHIRAWDCLGNMNEDFELFYVDNCAPEISIEVGDPQCFCTPVQLNELQMRCLCVTTQTPIYIWGEDVGCHGGVGLNYSSFKYRIMNDSGLWSEWILVTDLTDWTLYFEEECNHTLEITAEDLLGNKVTRSWCFHVDDQAPMLEIHVGNPNCTAACIGTDAFMVKTQTPIWFSAMDMGCCECSWVYIDYRVWYDGVWTEWQEYACGDIFFAEECMHYLEVRAYDCLYNTKTLNYTFYVDDSPPVITKLVGQPNCTCDACGEGNYCVTMGTEITLTAEDDTCSPCSRVKLEYMIQTPDGQFTDWMEYTGPFTFDEPCHHVLYVRAYDCLMNGYDDQYWDIEHFYVDEQGPDVEKIVNEPSFFLGVDPETGHDQWLVYPGTEINLTIVADDSCCPCEDGTILYRVWYLGLWSDWMVYEGNFTLDGGCLHYLEVKAIDCLGNEGQIDNETFWVCDSGGSSVPIIEIVNPQDGSSFDGRTLEVEVEAFDQETSWEDLIVKIGIPGGRRNAPDMWFDATHVGDGHFTVDVDVFMYQDGAQLTFDALALDEHGNVAWAVPVTITIESTVIWDQWMQQGWNSLTLPPDASCNTTVERVMSSIECSYDFVFHHIPLDGWISYYVNDEYNSLSTMESGKEYWVHVTAEQGAHYYIGGPQIEILSSQNGMEYESAEVTDFYGTAWSSDGGVESVDLVIINMVSQSEYLFWNGTDWTDEMSMVPADLEPSSAAHHQEWSFNSSTVEWIGGDFMVSAVATDKYGCTSSDEVSFSISLMIPEFTNVVLLQTYYDSWFETDGDFESGFTVWLEEGYEGEYYYLNLSNPETTTNVPLMEGYYPFYLTSYPSGYFAYWDAKGVNSSASPGSWEAQMYEIIISNEPIFYINVSSSQEFMLIDGLLDLLGSHSLLRVSTDYPIGDYTFQGHIVSDMGVTSDVVEVNISFEDVAPS